MGQEHYQIKKDGYCKARGGFAHFLLIGCAKCKSDVLLYQKDGWGRLLRMYADRIIAPKNLVDIQSQLKKKSDMQGLRCPSCNALLATPMVYEKENRLAYMIIKGNVLKTKTKGIFPQNER